MKERVTFLLVFSLLLSGFASPCACMDCSCAGEEAAQVEESRSCCHEQVAETSACCHHTAKKEPKSCCGKGHCECDHASMGCNCDEPSKEPEPAAPQPTSETSSNIQLVASLPMTHAVDLDGRVSKTAFGIEIWSAFCSSIPIYLSTHSILC